MSPWNCPSPGNWRPSSNAATGRAKRYRAIFAAGCFRPQPEQATISDLSQFYERIGTAGGAKFWYHALRNCFITVAERDLLLPLSLTKRLVNHARPNDVTEGYAADWTIGQLRQPAQRIADRIEALMNDCPAKSATASPIGRPRVPHWISPE